MSLANLHHPGPVAAVVDRGGPPVCPQFPRCGCPAWCVIVLFLLDWFDGYVARLRHEVTELGAVLDIALDRSVENILWITFMYLGLVPLWVPIIFLIRSFVVDGIRGVALARGKSGFGMMYSPLGRFLVASRFMRNLYGLAKGMIFGLLYLTCGPWPSKTPIFSSPCILSIKVLSFFHGPLPYPRHPGHTRWPFSTR